MFFSTNFQDFHDFADEKPRPVKKIPKIGDDKYVIESRVVFEPEDTSVSSGWWGANSLSFFLVYNQLGKYMLQTLVKNAI